MLQLSKDALVLHIVCGLDSRNNQSKKPVNDVGVTKLYGIDDIGNKVNGLRTGFVKEHSFAPPALVKELAPAERVFFKLLFTGRLYRKIYRLYELKA